MKFPRLFWSNNQDPKSWSSKDHNVMHFFYIPEKWWSIKHWVLAISFRGEAHKQLMECIAWWKTYKEQKSAREKLSEK